MPLKIFITLDEKELQENVIKRRERDTKSKGV